MFKDVPMKIVVPIIVVTWVLSLISSLAIVTVAPSLLGIKAGIDDGAVTSDKIAAGAVITVKMADGTVTSAKILDGTITAVDLVDDSIITAKIADDTIVTAKIVNSAVTTVKIADSAIITVKLANDSVTSAKIADGNVTSAKIADNAIVEVKLQDGAVTSAKIQDATITAADLATNSVTNIQIADNAVTTTKIADNAVTANKIASSAITNIKLADQAIPYRAISSTSAATTTSTSWTTIPGMSVDIILYQQSRALIIFSCEAYVETVVGLYVRAWVDNTLAAYPGQVQLTRLSDPGASVSDAGTYSFVWYYDPTGASTGTTHNIQIQFAMTSAGTGHVGTRTLVVFALP